jgi:hypothetical protein
MGSSPSSAHIAPPPRARPRLPSLHSDEWFHGELEEQRHEAGPQESALLPLLAAVPPPISGLPPPEYILESSLHAQLLWYSTAGRRPQQPPAVKMLVEQLWEKNQKLSAVSLDSGQTSDTLVSDGLQQLLSSRGSYSSMVSKSFYLTAVMRLERNRRSGQVPLSRQILLTVTLQIPKFRVVRSIPSEFECLNCLPSMTSLCRRAVSGLKVSPFRKIFA